MLVVEDNLFLRPRIEASLRGAGYEVLHAPGVESFARAIDESPVLVLVNLDSATIPWREIVGTVRDRFGEAVPIVGYGPHVDAELIASARAGGCTEVVPNGLIARGAAKVVATHVDAPAE